MKILQPLAVCILALSLTGCSALSALSSVLTTPLSLLSGMASAVSRTVSQADPPVEDSNWDAISERGSEIAARGVFHGTGASPAQNATETVARR